MANQSLAADGPIDGEQRQSASVRRPLADSPPNGVSVTGTDAVQNNEHITHPPEAPVKR